MRDYKKEYATYHSKPEQLKRRAARNAARRVMKGRKELSDDKDVHHKDNNPMNNDKSNLSIVSQHYNRREPRLRKEDLRKWFGKGKKGDWIRVGTDGEIKGDCAREPGEGKPKCMPRDKAHTMSKKDRASAARRKRSADPQTDRPGTGNKPIMVKTDKKKKNESIEMTEKNVPTNPGLWSKIKSQAKSKFDVYPSAYANGWAAKKYKAAGGGWKTKKESLDQLNKNFPNTLESLEEKESPKMKSFESIRRGIEIAKKSGGAMTPAVKKIDRIKKNLSSNPRIQKQLRKANEGDEEKKESVELEENKLKVGDKVKTPQGTVEIKARDTSAMRGKQDKFTMVLHMKNGKKASMGSHPAPTASAVTNIAKRFDKGVPSYMAHLKAESVEEKRDASKSATGYDIYHKTYSDAMQHAYAHAKKKHGVTVRDDEIDNKVATGVKKKPSTGKTTSHILRTDKKKNLHVQVYNTGKSYELNMYVESVELDEKFSFIVRDKDGKIAGGSSSEREAKMMASRIKGKVQPLKKPISNKQLDNMKVMGESVEVDEAKVRGADAYDKTFVNRKQADKFAREMGGRVKQVGRVFYVFKEEVKEGKWFVRQSAKPNRTGTYQGKKFDDGKKAIAQARKDWKLTPDEHMSAKMMKEEVDEVDLIEVMVKTGGKEVEVSKMKPAQIAQLKKAYGSIEKINVTGPAYKKAKKFIASLSKDELMAMAKAKIKWLSQFAASELRLTHNVKMKASEYMESVEDKTFAQLRNEATYQGKKVTLNKPSAGDVKKSKVYVDPDGDGVAKKVNFGDKNMTIKKNIPSRRKSFRARHNCDNPGPKDKARYWSCKAW